LRFGQFELRQIFLVKIVVERCDTGPRFALGRNVFRHGRAGRCCGAGAVIDSTAGLLTSADV